MLSGKLAAISFGTPEFHGFTDNEIRISKILKYDQNSIRKSPD